jgi:hypothetical protein
MSLSELQACGLIPVGPRRLHQTREKPSIRTFVEADRMEMREGSQNLIKGSAKLERAWIRYRLSLAFCGL